ncbi:MAG: SpoIIE family protein phosphatase [bacterium]|nr:SpoIIE family protein phosphatase [bacterium]
MKKETLLRNELSDLYAEIDLRTLLDKIAGKIRHYLNCQEASIFLYDSLREELVFEIATGKMQDELKQIVFKEGEGAVGWIAQQEKPLMLNDCSTDERFSSRSDNRTNFKTESLLGVPVHRDNVLLGVLEGVNKIDGKFDDTDRELLEYISRFVSIPLQNALLFKKVSREQRENARLLELAKIISYSSNQEEILDKLKEIICDIIDPIEINVMMRYHETNKIYRLLAGSRGVINEKLIDDTTIGENIAVFPLKSKNDRHGFLELKTTKRIPGEVITLIRGLAAFVAILIEKLEMQNRMIEKKKIEKELQIARRIQQSFLLTDPVNIDGLDIAYANIPSSEVGGDYYDIVRLNDTETILTINDICGHGIPASLLMSIFRTNFIYRINKSKNMLSTISHLNNLIALTTEPSLFVTSFMCRVNLEKMKINYVNAGHNPPFILRGNDVIKMDQRFLAVGVKPGISYEMIEEELRPGDLLVLYTDGIVETENIDEQQYTLSRLIDFMKNHREFSADDIKKAFIHELRAFVGLGSFDDDITFIIVKIKT